MNARHKLNSAAINGALLTAALAGGLFQSWAVFVIVAAVILLTSMHSREIRPSQGDPNPPRIRRRGGR